MYTKKRLCKLLNKYTRGYYMLDTPAIKLDLEKYTQMMSQAVSKKEKAQLNEICNYLKTLLGNIVNHAIQATWYVVDDALITSPVAFKNFIAYDLDTTRYILKREDRTVVICYKDLWDILALQIGHRDLDFNTKAIDQQLLDNKIGLHGLSDVQILYELTTNNAYAELVELRMDQTPYHVASKHGQYFTNYFGKPLNGDTYRESLTSTNTYANAIILEQLLEQIPVHSNLELLGVLGDSFFFNTDMSNEEVHKYLATSLLVRAFGRNFEILPSVTIY